jgi:nucleoside-diphosphate-sugar epimerase
MIRHLPVIGIFGDGSYRLQPIHVENLAELMVEKAYGYKNTIIHGIGPETFTYRGLVERLRDVLQVKRLIISVPPQEG